jgi:hypothetical protein
MVVALLAFLQGFFNFVGRGVGVADKDVFGSSPDCIEASFRIS